MDKLTKILNELDIDAILLTDYYNKRYFTGFTGTAGVALITKKGKYFVSDFRYTEQATKQVKEYGFKFIEDNTRSYNKLIEIAKNEQVSKLGIDELSLNFSEYEKIKSAFSFTTLHKASNKLINIRKIKTKEEILNIKKAIEISEKALIETISQIKVGMREFEIAAILEYNQRKQGASGTSFDTIVASGIRSSMPHGIASDKLIQKEEFITIDFGCYYNGYASDITRTIYIGNKIDDRMFEIYETVRKANELGCSLLKPGIIASSVDQKVREFMKEDAKYFGHSLGHSYGLEVHESPVLSTRDNSILEEGMCLTIEPGIYIPGYAGVRIEDDLVLTKEGSIQLTSLSKKLITINV